MPDSGLAIRIKRTVNTGLSVTDAGLVGGLNAGNLAKVIRAGMPDTINAVVKNFGTVALSNVRVTYAISRSGQPTALDTVFVPSMALGEQRTLAFGRLFTPAVVGTYMAYFTIYVPSDVGPTNNAKTAEIASAAFAIGQPTRIQYENGTLSGSTSWLGGGGFGISVDLPVYPVRVESVFVYVGTVTTQPMTVQILDGSSGVPGTILATRSVTAVGSSMNVIDFRTDSVRITSGRFFVGATGQMAFYYESTAPIAMRSWEYTNGWAPYRSADISDFIIRCSVRQQSPVAVGGEYGGVPTDFALDQNYPNPFNPSTKILYTVPKEARVLLKVYDVLGQEIATLVDGVQKVGEHEVEWNAAGSPSGVYFYRMQTDGYTSTKKLLLLK
jgi:hypothetical protein